MVDYKKLLLAYINHVGECEGVTFLSTMYGKVKGLTEEEDQILRQLDKESLDFFTGNTDD